MFHYSNFGQFGEDLRRFADINGYVPQQGDAVDDLTYPKGWFDDADATPEEIEEEWQDFVQEAVAATKEAERAVEAWRVGSGLSP